MTISVCEPVVSDVFHYCLPDNNSFGYDMGWWKEEHFNASDADEDGLLNITEFNE